MQYSMNFYMRNAGENDMNGNLYDMKYEKIDGVIYNMSPSGDYRHGRVNLNIFKHIDKQLKDNLCMIFVENLDYRYDIEKEDFLIPDLMLLCDRKKIKGGQYMGTPRFIVETLSPSTALRDRTTKKDIYEKSGVEEYWIVDVNAMSIETYILEDSRYVLKNVWTLVLDKQHPDYNAECYVGLSVMSHIKIALKDVFDGIYEL